jgi:hypothetical protein
MTMTSEVEQVPLTPPQMSADAGMGDKAEQVPLLAGAQGSAMVRTGSATVVRRAIRLPGSGDGATGSDTPTPPVPPGPRARERESKPQKSYPMPVSFWMAAWRRSCAID